MVFDPKMSSAENPSSVGLWISLDALFITINGDNVCSHVLSFHPANEKSSSPACWDHLPRILKVFLCELGRIDLPETVFGGAIKQPVFGSV